MSQYLLKQVIGCAPLLRETIGGYMRLNTFSNR